LRAIEWCDRRRARGGESYGDQAQFFRRELLQSVGGFPDQSIMEDVELSVRLRRLGAPIYLDLPVIVSARRFVRMKWWRVAWQNFRLRRHYRRRGLAACAELYQRYYRTR
jgi:GT2 family glycosyltransferase